jgi:hypothetical protein
MAQAKSTATKITDARTAAEMVMSLQEAKTFPDKSQSVLVGMMAGRYFKKQKKYVDPTTWEKFKSEVYNMLKFLRNEKRLTENPQWYDKD